MAEPPDWFISGKTKSVTSSSHIIGLGSGNSHAVAIDKALADIIKHIEVSIKSESSNYLSSFLDNDHESITSQYNSTISSVTEGGVKGAETIEKTLDGNVHYVMMAISRLTYIKQLSTEITTHYAAIAQFEADSEELVNQGKVIVGLGLLMETIDIASEIATREALYLALSGSVYPAIDKRSSQALLSAIRRSLNRLKLQKVSGDNQSAKRGDPLSEPIIVKSMYVSETGSEIPLSNIKLKLTDEKGKTLETRLCDENGMVSFRVSAFGRQHGSVSVAINILGLPPIFKRDLRDLSVTFDYDVKNAVTLPLSISIEDERGIPADLVAHSVSNVVIELGHIVLGTAPLQLKGIIRTEDQREIDGLFGKQYIAKVKMTMELIVVNEDKSIGSLVISSKGIHKKSKEHAIEAAYRKMSISEKKLAAMFADLSSTLSTLIAESSKNSLKHGKKMYKAGNYVEAARSLAQVTMDEKMVNESKKIIQEIKIKTSK